MSGFQKLTINVKKLKHCPALPEYAEPGASGMDAHAAISEPMIVGPTQHVLVPTGICVEIPEGFELQVRPRSGMSLNTNLMVLNSPGTIDSSYRGEIKIIMGNMGNGSATINPGTRIAQLVLCPVWQVQWNLVNELSESARGSGGFGSTGAI
jgi:dUTP pyrophosphatase